MEDEGQGCDPWYARGAERARVAESPDPSVAGVPVDFTQGTSVAFAVIPDRGLFLDGNVGGKPILQNLVRCPGHILLLGIGVVDSPAT